MMNAKFLTASMTMILLFALSGAVSGQGNSKGKGKDRDKAKTANSKKAGADANGGNAEDHRDRSYDDHDGPGKTRKEDKPTSGRFNGLAKKIGMSPERAQDWYERERYLNPRLTFGQFVAANMIARKHSDRYPRLTAKAILIRMRDGESLGQAVKSLGLKDRDYDRERRRIDDVFSDNDRDWERERRRKSVGEIVDDYIYRIGW